MKKNPLYTQRHLIWQCKCIFVTITMAVNSTEPTIPCDITPCVWLYSFFHQDLPSLEFFVFVVFVAFIVVGNFSSGKDG